MKVIIKYRKQSFMDDASNVINTAFAHITHKIRVVSIKENGKDSNTFDRYETPHYIPFSNSEAELEVTFDLQGVIPSEVSKNLLSETEKLIKEAISLRGYLKFIRFEDMPKVIDYNIFSFKSKLQDGYHSAPIDSLKFTTNTLGEKLLSELKTIALGKEELTRPFFESLKNRNYAQAVRRACTTTDPVGFELIKVLFASRHLCINLNAVGKDERTALHYAAITGCVDLYNFLKEKGANPNLKDAHQKSAEAYLIENTRNLTLSHI